MTDAPFSKNVPPESKQVIQSVAASQPGHTRFKRAFAIGCAEVRQTIRATAAHISACLAFSRQQIASWSLYRQCRARKMQLADAMIKTGAAGDKLRARLAELSTRKPDDRIELLGFSTGRQLSELKLRIADDALSKTTSPEQVKCQLRAAQDAVREFRDAECECRLKMETLRTRTISDAGRLACGYGVVLATMACAFALMLLISWPARQVVLSPVMKNQHAGRLDIASDQEPNSRSYVATAGSSLDKGIRSLPALMQERGMRYSSQNDVQQFVEQASSKEIDVDLNGTFVIPNIPVYYVQQNDETDDDVVLCKAVVPFRLYKSKSLDREIHVGLSGAATMVSVCRANLADAWFLTKDNQLQRCSSRTEVAVIRQNNGYIYVPEAMHSAILCCGKYDTATAKALKGLPFNAFDHRSATPSGEFRAKIVIQRLDYCHVLQWQESWGFYQLRALEKNDWDSDYLMNWNFSGAFTGLVPDYFHPSDSDNPQLPCARLFAFELIGPNKQIIASFRQAAVD